MTTPTLRQLEIFAQMVASGNIQECATILGVSAITIENDLHALETRLGHQLFTIDGARVRLTAAGRKTVDAMAMLSKIQPERWDDAHAPQETVAAEVQAPAQTHAQEVAEAAPLVQLVTAPVEVVEDIQLPLQPHTIASPPDDDTPLVSQPDELSIAPEDGTPAPLEAPAAEQPEPDASAPEAVEEPVASETIISAAEQDNVPEAVAPTADGEDAPLELAGEVEDDAQPEDMVAHDVAQAADAIDEIPAPTPETIPETIQPEEPEDLPEEPVESPVPIAPPPPIELALRVVFTAPAPATYPAPIIVSLFPAQPLTQEPEPVPEPLPDPVLEPEPQPEPEPAPEPEPEQQSHDIPQFPPPPVVERVATTQQQVTVAAHPSVFGHFQDALTAFEQANPDVAIALELDAFTATRAEPLLASGKVDIVYYYAMGERERFESRYVWSERLSLFIGARHPLAKKDEVSVDDLLRIRPVLLGSRNGLRPVLDNAMQRAGMDLWEPALETDNLFDIMKAVRNGAGYFAAFGPLARDFGKMDGIRRMPFVDFLPPVEVRQAVRDEVRDDPVVASLAEYLFR
ncbi:hypothetical protein BH10PSE12_BH10PSE12_23510 [soil metagenome]